MPFEYARLAKIEEAHKELELLRSISQKQDLQIAVLEKILKVLERREDDGK